MGIKNMKFINSITVILTLVICTLCPVSGNCQSNDVRFDKAYKKWSSGDSEDKKQANEVFIELAQDGFAKAYPYAALSCIKTDIDSFEFYGDLALDNGGNWIGKQLGDHYYETKQYVKAARTYEKALDSGWRGDVAYKLGKMYEDGLGVPVNIEKALELYKVSMNDSHMSIEHTDAYKRFKALGSGSIYDREKFFEAEGKVDKSLSAEELYKKGDNLMDGFGITKDPYKGYAYIKAAADKGLPKAMAALSGIYRNSLYGLNDEDASKVYAELAVSTYKKQALQGDGDACCELGNCYGRGYLTEKDKEQSHKYYMQGANLGHWHCIRYCGQIFESEGNYPKAIEYYKRAVDKNEMMAAYYLANMYLDGKGTSKDRDKAIELYKVCAKSHWACKSDAISKLKSLGVDTSAYKDRF